MTRHNFCKTVKRAAFLRANGRCEEPICGKKLGYGEAEYHHILEDFHGGEPTLDNCQVLCKKCHAETTQVRRSEVDKTRRIEEKRMGLRKPSRPMRHPTLRRKISGEVVLR